MLIVVFLIRMWYIKKNKKLFSPRQNMTRWLATIEKTSKTGGITVKYGQPKECLTEKNIADFQYLLQKYLEDYQTKKTEISKKEWLEQLFCLELSKPRKAKGYAKTIVNMIEIYQKNLESLQEAIQHGILKEQWLSEKIQNVSVGMAIDEYGQMLQVIRDMLYQKNKELAEVLQHSVDGDIPLTPELERTREEEITIYAEDISKIRYSYYQTKDLILSIEKNVEVMNLQTAAITTGVKIAYQNLPSKKSIHQKQDEVMFKIAIAGILQIAVQKEWFSFLPKEVPSSMIACISCIGIENAAILEQIATKKIPMMKGIDQMGYQMLSLIGVAWDIAENYQVECLFLDWKSVLGIPFAIMNGFLEGIAFHWKSTSRKDTLYQTGKEVANITKSIAKSGIKGIRPSSRQQIIGK